MKSITPDSPYTGADIYCDEIIPGIRPVQIVAENELVMAFHHTRSHWPIHIVVIPKRHIDSLLYLNPQDQEIIWQMVSMIQMVARQVIDEYGAAAVLTNLGNDQDSKHLHWHIHAGPALNPKA